jgi:hypothetical protein
MIQRQFFFVAQKQTIQNSRGPFPLYLPFPAINIFTFMVTRSTQAREKSSSRSPACHTISSLPRQNERATEAGGGIKTNLRRCVRAPGFWRQKITPSSVGGRTRARNNYLFFICTYRKATPASEFNQGIAAHLKERRGRA